MTNMANSTRRLTAALAVAAGTVFGCGTASADPEPTPVPAPPAPTDVAPAPGAPAPAPAGNVHYTVTTDAPYDFTITYLVNQPPDMKAYNANFESYGRRDYNVHVTPDAPWRLDTRLSDPQWAFLQVSSTNRGGMAAPNAHCEIAADGLAPVQNTNPYSPMCKLSKW